jgi:sirohydrochlorin cobaltochelatase
MSDAIVLFAHGARDARWAEPFERLRVLVAERAAPAPVVLAYLELMEPALDAAVDALVADGATALTIVPVFFGQGGHVRNDLPRLVGTLRRRHAGLALHVAPTVGEDEAVQVAIAEYCFRSAAPGSSKP